MKIYMVVKKWFLMVFNGMTENVLSQIEVYWLSDIYKADKTGLLYDLLHNKILWYKNEKCFGAKKKRKMRLIICLMVNADRIDKLLSFFTERAVNPRCFKIVKNFSTKYEAKFIVMDDFFPVNKLFDIYR